MKKQPPTAKTPSPLSKNLPPAAKDTNRRLLCDADQVSEVVVLMLLERLEQQVHDGLAVDARALPLLLLPLLVTHLKQHVMSHQW